MASVGADGGSLSGSRRTDSTRCPSSASIFTERPSIATSSPATGKRAQSVDELQLNTLGTTPVRNRQFAIKTTYLLSR